MVLKQSKRKQQGSDFSFCNLVLHPTELSAFLYLIAKSGKMLIECRLNAHYLKGTILK